MKYCPNCQTNYTDDTLQFCLQDGAPLTEIANPTNSDMPTVAFGDEETVLSSRKVEPIRVELPGIERYNPQASQENINLQQSQERIYPQQTQEKVYPQQSQERIYPQQSQERISVTETAPKKSNTTSIVLLTALLTALLLGGAAWLFMKDRKTEVAVNVNTAPKTNRPVNSNLTNNQETSVSNQESNANLTEPTRTPDSTPKPTINPETAKAVTQDVEDTVDKWENDSESLDLDGHLSQYADTVDYYTAGRIGLSRVRADKKKAFETYDLINFDITNMKITPDATGEKATAVFDKEWTFEGAQKNSSGKVQQQLTLNKINGKWLITSEKDLKVYYVNNK